MKIPVFISSPSALNAEQEFSRNKIISFVEKLNLEPRALGRSDYPTEYPVREVLVIAKHCSGGVILGFEQIQVFSGLRWPGTKQETRISNRNPVSIPTSWNQLEAGILFGLRLPLLIFREKNISGGVFDNGVTDVFVHNLPVGNWTAADDTSLNEVFLKWFGKVHEAYYR